MRNPWTLGVLLGALGATSALGAEWQAASKAETNTTSVDKQSLKRLDGSRIRVDIMMKYTQPQPQAGEKFVIPEHDTSIGDYVVNCTDYTSTNQRNTWYLNSKLVKEFNGTFNLPTPPQFEKGVPAAFKLACSLAGR
jgi:hypothetical protein